MYEVDVEALVQAYVNIVAGACISLGKSTSYETSVFNESYDMCCFFLIGLRFAGTRDGNARDLLNNYALYLLHEVHHSLKYYICYSFFLPQILRISEFPSAHPNVSLYVSMHVDQACVCTTWKWISQGNS